MTFHIRIHRENMSDFKKIKNKLIDIIPSELFHLNSKQTRSNFQFYDQVIRVQTDPAIKKVITIAYKKYPSSQKIPLKTNFNSSKKSGVATKKSMAAL